MSDRRRPSKRPAGPSVKEVKAEVMAIYADLEKRPLSRNCTGIAQCCHFRLTGKTPVLTKGEAVVAAVGVRASGRTKLRPHPDGACPLLGDDGRCTIYEHRPFGCRTHFCAAAGGVQPRREIIDLIRRLEVIDEKLGGDGSKPLEGAVAAVMD